MTQNNADLLRSQLKKARRDMPEAQRQRASLLMRAKLFTWIATTRTRCAEAGTPPPSIVAGFWPLADEPDLTALYRQWHEQGIVVVLPVMQSTDQTLQFHAWEPGMTMREVTFGVQEPQLSRPLLPDVVLVPTLGFTPQGQRMGYGKGFYDRTLASFAGLNYHPTLIGVAWDNANLHDLDPSYEAKSHDHPLDAIATSTAWHPEEPRWRGIASA